MTVPGVNIYSTYPNKKYSLMNGTSMACPHVAATVALIIAEDLEDGTRHLSIGTYDSDTKWTIRGVLHKTAQDINVPGNDDASGYGLVAALSAVLEVPYEP